MNEIDAIRARAPANSLLVALLTGDPLHGPSVSLEGTPAGFRMLADLLRHMANEVETEHGGWHLSLSPIDAPQLNTQSVGCLALDCLAARKVRMAAPPADAPALDDAERSLLTAVFELGAHAHGVYRKSAAVLTRALRGAGRLTPEADAVLSDDRLEPLPPEAAALYARLARLAREKRYLDGQGNFGSPEGEHPPAHPWYTDCRLTDLGQSLFEVRHQKDA